MAKKRKARKAKDGPPKSRKTRGLSNRNLANFFGSRKKKRKAKK